MERLWGGGKSAFLRSIWDDEFPPPPRSIRPIGGIAPCMNTNKPSHGRASDPMRIYVYKDQQQLGPLTIEEALTKERDGSFQPNDNAWVEGESTWIPLQTLLRRFGPPPPPAVATPPTPPPPSAPQLSAQSRVLIRRNGNEFGPYPVEVARQYLQTGNIHSTDEAKPDGASEWYPVTTILGSNPPLSNPRKISHLWLWFMITGILAVVLSIVAEAVLTPDEGRSYIRTSQKNAGAVLLILCWGNFVAAFVISNVMLYRGWTLVQRPGSPTTPGQAVGLMFVPLFNLYWQFIAIRGMAVEMNQQQRPGLKSVNVGLATAVCVCTCVLTIPPLAPLAFLGYTVTGIIFWKPVAERI